MVHPRHVASFWQRGLVLATRPRSSNAASFWSCGGVSYYGFCLQDALKVRWKLCVLTSVNLPPGHDALLLSICGTGSFICPMAPGWTYPCRPLFISSYGPLGGKVKCFGTRQIRKVATSRSIVEHANHHTTMTAPSRTINSTPLMCYTIDTKNMILGLWLDCATKWLNTNVCLCLLHPLSTVECLASSNHHHHHKHTHTRTHELQTIYIIYLCNIWIGCREDQSSQIHVSEVDP